MELSLISSSSSSSSTTQIKYDVFLSFRGEDTRYNFTSHLHKALCEKQIDTFIDYKLNRGDKISPSLLKAIEQSHISIVVFSKGYASSRWCLEELVKILQCKNTYGQIVIPIFYEVDPSDVRNQTGSFADAFAMHEQRYKDSMQIWKDALKEAANLSGSDSRVIKPESMLIEAIVQDVLKRLNDLPSSDASDLVGIDSRITEIESLLCIGNEDVRSVGIWGVGGIGKTTLAGAIFDKISCQFEGSYFIPNVTEESEQSGGLKRLRQELFSAILGDKNVNLGTSAVGRTFTRNRLGRKKLFIVFDDVTSFRQIESLIGNLSCLGLGSRIIVTSRDKQVLKNCRVNQIYKVDELSDNDALKLFCLYAFRQNRLMVDFEELSNMVVEYVGGIPLALKVLGSSLLDKGKEVWESAIIKLQKIPDKNIQKALKISYDELDDDEQNIFLDIACFFKGRDIDLVKKFVDASGFFAEIGITTLIDKSLIAISDYNSILMHDLLQAMGREIVRQESIDDPSKRSRLWHHEDIYNVLTRNTGTDTIVGISLNMSKIADVHLKPDPFAKMHRLRFLEVYFSHNDEHDNKVHCSHQDLESIFTQLTYLKWDGYPFKSLQSKFHPQNLVVLRMRYSNIQQLWNGVQQVPNLKEIDLSYSKHLTGCPDLSGAPNLESLELEGCTSLFEIPPSIQHLEKLIILKLIDCKSLEALPDCIRLKSLRQLYLNGCSNFKKLSGVPCNLETLELSKTAIEELPSSIEYLCKLLILNLGGCSRLVSLPSSICKLKSLDHLYLSGCSKLDKLPENFGDLESLTLFVADETAIREVPSSIVQLDNLTTLSFTGCNGQETQDTMGFLLPSLFGLHGLIDLDLVDCGLIEIPDSVGQLSSLQRLSLGRNSFESIPTSIINLSNLVSLDVGYCKRLKSLPELPWTRIYAHNCTSLEGLSCLSIVDKRKKTENNPQEFPRNMALNFISFCFINCLKLDQNLLRDFVEDTLLKIQRGMEEYLYKVSNETSRALICCPGSEIPNWFDFQSTGSFITMELSPGWFNKKFVGFALCIIVAIRDHLQDRISLAVECECKLQSKDGRQHVIYGTLWGWPLNGPECIRSDHLFLGCDYHMYPYDIGASSYTNVISVHFHLKDTNYYKCVEFCEVIKCGVRLMYAQDFGRSSGSFSSDDGDEFWESVEKLSSDDEDEFWESMEEASKSFSTDEEED